ncbi:hypothetical protein [Saccharomonospora saliphila]|uniref:hypothetical protein n=1 Tax=Saccharomonospora saliphila TaxID=369829 RepID=UPI0012F8628A|nr:hypothetical protein [Saccharomonospora saliphila]
MSTSTEMVVGYDGDGRPHEVIVVDGHEAAAVTYYELDPDARLLRRGHHQEWLHQQEQCATQASPQAARWIRRWAQQTAQSGAIALDEDV